MQTQLRWISKFARTVTARFVVLPLLLLSAALAYQSIDKEDKFFIRDAAPVDPNYLLTLESWKRQPSDLYEPTGIAAHRLKSGTGMVFGYRFFSDGKIFTNDDESYKKLTIWLAEGVPQSPIEIGLGDANRVLVVYSRGGSAWPTSLYTSPLRT